MGGQKKLDVNSGGGRMPSSTIFSKSSMGNIGGGLGIVSEKSKTVSSRYLDGKMPCGY